MKELNQIDKNLLLFLDPLGRYNEQSWDFNDGAVCAVDALLSPGRNVVACFTRKKLLDYYVISLKLFFLRKGKYRKVYFVNDGLLSSIFYSVNISAYRAYAKNHLQKPNTFRQRLVALLPLVWRAETRFIVVYYVPTRVSKCDYPEIDGLVVNGFMFFSNAAGKLLLLTIRSLLSGKGLLVKTTTDPEYISAMEKEFQTVALLSDRLGGVGGFPKIGKHLKVKSRHFFTEEYILGENLREKLRVLGGRGDSVQVCGILDSLDEWSSVYHASFSGSKVPIVSLYTHLFSLFSGCYGSNGKALLRSGTGLLAQISAACPGVIPITAHNDLWPGNILVTKHGFTVIDWERATEHRAPFFDYFWMILSTTIEFLAHGSENYGYSGGIRTFLSCTDEVSCHAFQKLKTFMDRIGVAEQYLPNLLFLFFMEWSVQGFQILGRQSDMDRLAFGELLHYAGRNSSQIPNNMCSHSDDPLVSEYIDA